MMTTISHQEFLFPVFFGFFDPFANKEVRDDAENQDANIASARLVVEEKAREKEERVTEEELVVYEGEYCKDNGEETPKIELRKEQRRVRVERECVT
jgi:hypothetical protein